MKNMIAAAQIADSLSGGNNVLANRAGYFGWLSQLVCC
jgi:hypothetical protein